MATEWTRAQVAEKLIEGLRWAYDEAFIDDEVGFEQNEEFPTITLIQHDLDTNEPVARFTVSFWVMAEGSET